MDTPTGPVYTHTHTHTDVVSGCNWSVCNGNNRPVPSQAEPRAVSAPQPLAAITQSAGVMSCKLNICKKAVINAVSYLHGSRNEPKGVLIDY